MGIFFDKAREMKKDVMAIYLAYKRPDVPWFAKLMGIIVVGYALSPIDLIPDFIPLMGYLDDLVIVSLGIWVVVRLIPDEVMEECRLQAEEIYSNGTPRMWLAAVIIIIIWTILIGLIVYKIMNH